MLAHELKIFFEFQQDLFSEISKYLILTLSQIFKR